MFKCAPNGTVYDETVHQCRYPSEILPNIPECAKWDANYRPLFEEEVEQEVTDIDETESSLIEEAVCW